MQPIRSLALSLAGALLLPGCFVQSEPLPLATSFAVTATLSFEFGPGSDLPDNQRFRLRLEDTADTSVAAVFESSGGSSTATFTRAGSRLSLREPVDVKILFRYGSEDEVLAMESIKLKVLDRDGDGSVDAVEGSGSGRYSYFAGDYEFGESFTIEMSGEIDEDAP